MIVKPDPGSAAKLRTLGHIRRSLDHDRRAGNRNDAKRCGWYAVRSPMADQVDYER